MGIPRDFVLLNCTQDSKLDASSNQKLLACVQILWLLFSLKHSSPASPDTNTLSSWKSLVPDLKSAVRAHLYSKSSIKWLSLTSLSLSQPLLKHIRGAPLFILRETQINCFTDFLGRRKELFTIHLQDKNIHRKI